MFTAMLGYAIKVVDGPANCVQAEQRKDKDKQAVIHY